MEFWLYVGLGVFILVVGILCQIGQSRQQEYLRQEWQDEYDKADAERRKEMREERMIEELERQNSLLLQQNVLQNQAQTQNRLDRQTGRYK